MPKLKLYNHKKIADSAAVILNKKLSDLVPIPPKEGFLYGLELELEGQGVGLEGIPSKNWKRVEDGSLRGESMEYVFNKPCEYDEAIARVKKLFSLLEKHGVKLKDSYRTSTHVHLNFSDKTGKQIVNFFLLHTILEEILEYYCGDLRKGNLFCLSCRDNEDLLRLLEQSLFAYASYLPFDAEVRYNAANLASLNKFGTIEIRTMRGVNNAEEVVDWMEILRNLYEFSCSNECPPPWKLVEKLSHLGPEGFLGMIFPQNVVTNLMKSWPAVKDLRRSLMEGVRLVQFLAYKLEDSWMEDVPEPKVPKILFGEGRYRIEKSRDGRPWYVRHNYNDGELVEDDVNLIYDARTDCFIDTVTGGKCRWLMYNGEEIIPGTANDKIVNWFLYRDEEEEEDEEPDEGPDWGDEGDDLDVD